MATVKPLWKKGLSKFLTAAKIDLMTTTTARRETTPAEDLAITRALRSLLGYHGLQRNALVPVFPSSEATLFRRFRIGGWTAAEVKALARAFAVPSGDLLDGDVDTRKSRWQPAGGGDSPDPDGEGTMTPEGVRTARSLTRALDQAA